MSQLDILIDKGNSIYGSQKELARQLGKPDTHISMWRKGKRSCTAPDRAELAAAVNENPTVAALEAVIEGIDTNTEAGRKARAELEKALSKVRKLYLSAISAARRVVIQRPQNTQHRTARNTVAHTKFRGQGSH